MGEASAHAFQLSIEKDREGHGRAHAFHLSVERMDREGRGVAEARVRSREERRALRDEARPEQLARGRALRTGLGGSANSFLFFGFDNL